MKANSLFVRTLSGLVLVLVMVGMTLAWYDPATGIPGWTFYLLWSVVGILSLADAGMADAATGIRGWHFAWGSTGLCPLGNGLFYVSHNARKADGTETCTARLYRWTGAADCPLEPVGQARE